uniref:Uncharacterized protein n=1 Tax=Prolemur simus TaxID=1328070 RepID=A0A8C9DKY4_PROSS
MSDRKTLFQQQQRDAPWKVFLCGNSLWTPYTNCGPSRKNQKHLQ